MESFASWQLWIGSAAAAFVIDCIRETRVYPFLVVAIAVAVVMLRAFFTA